MTKVMKSMLQVLVVGLLLSSPVLSIAQEEIDYSWGTVVEITDQQLVLEEYDYDTESYAQVTYEIDGSVELENIETLQDIQQGNEVEVGFIERDGKRIVMSLYLEKEAPVFDYE